MVHAKCIAYWQMLVGDWIVGFGSMYFLLSSQILNAFLFFYNKVVLWVCTHNCCAFREGSPNDRTCHVRRIYLNNMPPTDFLWSLPSQSQVKPQQMCLIVVYNHHLNLYTLDRLLHYFLCCSNN